MRLDHGCESAAVEPKLAATTFKWNLELSDEPIPINGVKVYWIFQFLKAAKDRSCLKWDKLWKHNRWVL